MLARQYFIEGSLNKEGEDWCGIEQRIADADVDLLERVQEAVDGHGVPKEALHHQHED